MKVTFANRAYSHVFSRQRVFALRADVFDSHSAPNDQKNYPNENGENPEESKNNNQQPNPLNQATDANYFIFFLDLMLFKTRPRLNILSPQKDVLAAMR